MSATTTTMMILAPLAAVQGASPEGSQTVWEFLQSGGALMIPIGLCSVFVLAFAIERYFALRRARVCPAGLDEVLEAIRTRRFEAATVQLGEDKSAGARILTAGLRRRGLALAEVESAMEDQAQKELEKLRHNIRPIAVIGTIAPLLGLLGTVLGIAESFRRVKQAGMGKPEVLAGGIEMALTTTIAGLIVAIPALLVASYLQGRLRRLMLGLDERVAPAIEWLARSDRGESHAA